MNFTKFITEAFIQGGGSYNILSNAINPLNGFMVATIGNEERLHINQRLKKHVQIEELFKASNDYVLRKLLNEKPRNSKLFLGLWFNKQDGFWYLDLSEHITNKEEVIILGVEYNQIAIWDCANNIEIVLDNKQHEKTSNYTA